MTAILNNFAGGTDGVGITTGNSGGASGTALNGTGANGTNTAVYDDDIDLTGGITHSVLISGSGTRTLAWNTAWAGSAVAYATATFRADDATPVNAVTLMAFYTSDESSTGCSVRLDTAGHIVLRAPTTTRYTSSIAMSDGVPFRLRVRVASNATTGHISCEIYKGANLWGSQPDETFGSDSANWNTGDGTIGGIGIGMLADPGQTWNLTVAAIGLSDTGHIAPLGTAPATPTVLDTPPNWTTTPSAGIRSCTMSWTSVANADEGYEVQVQVLDVGGNPADDADWSLIDTENIASPSGTSVVINDADGLDWGKTFRARIRALTASDNP